MKINICSNYNEKLSKEINNKRTSHDWSMVEKSWVEDEIVNLTTTKGISPYKYKDGHRCNDSWIASHAIMLDFDDGKMTVERLLSYQKKWLFNSYVFSSQNHQKEKNGKPACDRLRVIIPLKTLISDLSVWNALKAYFLKEFPELDASCFDIARYFAHGTDEVSSFVDDKGFLDWTTLSLDLTPKKKQAGYSTPLTQELTLAIQVKDGFGKLTKLEDIKPDVPIFCPYCGDSPKRTNNTHNAVIKINDDGFPFLFCSSCKSRGMGHQGVYNFTQVDAFIYAANLKDKMLFIDTLKSKTYGGCIESGDPEFVWREQSSKDYVNQFCKFPVLRTYQ